MDSSDRELASSCEALVVSCRWMHQLHQTVRGVTQSLALWIVGMCNTTGCERLSADKQCRSIHVSAARATWGWPAAGPLVELVHHPRGRRLLC